MSQNQALAKLHEEHHPETLKYKVGRAVTSHWFELIIIVCIFADIGLVAMEMGIDHHFFCVAGRKVPVSREELTELAEGGGSKADHAGGSAPLHLLATAAVEESWRQGLDELLASRERHGLAFLQRELASSEHPGPQEEAAAVQGANRANTLLPYKKFKLACLRHVEKLVSKNDRSHTDVHLERELLQQCDLEKEYPLTSQDGFEDPDACRDFASILVKARNANLKDGNLGGYEYFCGRYYMHKGGKIPDGTPISTDPEWGVDPTDVHPPAEISSRSEEKEVEESGEHGEEEEEAALVCEDKHGHHSHHIAHTCHFWSVAILCFFMLELLVKIWISPSAFFGNFFHVLDLIVVSVSLFIDTIMVQLVMYFWGDSTAGFDILSLLLLTSRLWRIARIIHGIFEVVLAQKEEMDELQHEISENKEANEKLEAKIQRLESRTG